MVPLATDSQRDEDLERGLAQIAVGYERWGLKAEADDVRQAYREAILRRIKRGVGIATDSGLTGQP